MPCCFSTRDDSYMAVSFNSTIHRAQSFVIVTSASWMHTIKCCSVVFDVTLRLLVINILSSSTVKNKRRRLPATSVINFPRSGAAACNCTWRSNHSRHTMEPDIESRFFAFPTHIWRPRSSEYCQKVWCGKTGKVWLPVVEKVEDVFIHFSTIHERVRRTEGQTDRQTPHDGIGRAYA